MQESVNKATSGKKDSVQKAGQEVKKTHLEDVTIFSQDARKLKETEIILQNALQKLHEMDEINEENLAGIKDKIASDFYDNEEVYEKIINDIFPEQELRTTVERRMKAERYLPEVKKYDDENYLDFEKLHKIKERVNNDFYFTNEVSERIADELLSILEV